MQLLVSVTNALEAAAALAGGADIIDAKDPEAGPLGPVAIAALRGICGTVAGVRPVTAALGDAVDEASVEQAARGFSAAGAALVKVGFAGVTSSTRAETLTTAAVRGVHAGSAQWRGVIVVAYADANRAMSLPPAALLEVAVRVGVAGVLLDTADKAGPGLRELCEAGALAAWVAEARAAGLLVALAGKLAAGDLLFVRDAGADIAGVRGAACEGGRTGRVATEKVRALKSGFRSAVGSPAPLPDRATDLLRRRPT